MTLRRLGQYVRIAHGAREALAMARSMLPNVVFLDWATDLRALIDYHVGKPVDVEFIKRLLGRRR